MYPFGSHSTQIFIKLARLKVVEQALQNEILRFIASESTCSILYFANTRHPLAAASMLCLTGTVSKLIEMDTELSTVCRTSRWNYDRAILSACYRKGNAETIQALLNAGADPNFFDGDPLVHACSYQDVALAKVLLDHGADPSLRRRDYLGAVTFLNNLEIVKMLLDHPRSSEIDLEHSISTELEYNRVEIFELLLDHGVITKN